MSSLKNYWEKMMSIEFTNAPSISTISMTNVDMENEYHPLQQTESDAIWHPLLSEPDNSIFTEENHSSAKTKLNDVDTVFDYVADTSMPDADAIQEKTEILNNMVNSASTPIGEKKLKAYKELVKNTLELATTLISTILIALSVAATGGATTPLLVISSLLLANALTNTVFSAINVVRVKKDLPPIGLDGLLRKGTASLLRKMNVSENTIAKFTVDGFTKFMAGYKVVLATTQALVGLFVASPPAVVSLISQISPLVILATSITINYFTKKKEDNTEVEMEELNPSPIQLQEAADEVAEIAFSHIETAAETAITRATSTIDAPSLVKPQDALIQPNDAQAAKKKMEAPLSINAASIGTISQDRLEEKDAIIKTAIEGGRTVSGEKKTECYRDLAHKVVGLVASIAAIGLLIGMTILSGGAAAPLLIASVVIASLLLVNTVIDTVFAAINLARVKKGLPEISIDTILRNAVKNMMRKLNFEDRTIQKVDEKVLTYAKTAFEIGVVVAKIPSGEVTRPPLIDTLWHITPIITGFIDSFIDLVPLPESDDILVDIIESDAVQENINQLGQQEASRLTQTPANGEIPANAVLV